MFKKLFKRGKARPAPSPTPEAAIPAPVTVTPDKGRLEAFRDGWEEKWETAHEVVESNGGDTEWGMWTEAKKAEENSFADTVLEDDDSLASTRPTPLGRN